MQPAARQEGRSSMISSNTLSTWFSSWWNTRAFRSFQILQCTSMMKVSKSLRWDLGHVSGPQPTVPHDQSSVLWKRRLGWGKTSRTRAEGDAKPGEWSGIERKDASSFHSRKSTGRRLDYVAILDAPNYPLWGIVYEPPATWRICISSEPWISRWASHRRTECCQQTTYRQSLLRRCHPWSSAKPPCRARGWHRQSCSRASNNLQWPEN